MENEELKFRRLNASEVDVRVGQCNKGGASLLLYMDARAACKILDEAVGPLNWQKRYTNDNANCIVSIYNSRTGQWVEKEDTGTKSNTEAEKGLASDSFKRACVCWGIGRELYSSPRMFVPKEKLGDGFVQNGDKFKCYNGFSVNAIEYDAEGNITFVSVNVYGSYGKFLNTVTFGKGGSQQAAQPAAQAPVQQAAPARQQAQPAAPKAPQAASVLTDADIAVMYAKAEIAGTSETGINEWVQKKFGLDDPRKMSREQYQQTCAALDSQAEKKKQEGAA